jgi:predicted ATP-grasp superfamily ATP-dependent carboligase
MKSFVSISLIVCALMVGMILTRPVESARRYEYRVISITAIKQLRTQSDAEQGQMRTIEKTINEQAAQGWELFQADGYVLYFRR